MVYLHSGRCCSLGGPAAALVCLGVVRLGGRYSLLVYGLLAAIRGWYAAAAGGNLALGVAKSLPALRRRRSAGMRFIVS